MSTKKMAKNLFIKTAALLSISSICINPICSSACFFTKKQDEERIFKEYCVKELKEKHCYLGYNNCLISVLNNSPYEYPILAVDPTNIYRCQWYFQQCKSEIEKN